MKNQITLEIAWQAPEFKEHKKSMQWFLAFGTISVALMAYAVYSRSLISIISFAVGILITYFFAVQKPKNQTYSISGMGVAINNNLIPYKNIRKFWIIYNPQATKTLNLETTGYLNNQVSIELGNQDPVAVKLYLKRYLPEDLDKEESLTDVLARKAKF
ncbi:MAG: hypothetical protein HYV13_03435 [Candidatus Doudnabacteria bacterium]|nr:hypothetical protein [Candidatus Doudnabacteria bacterium]